MTLVRTRLTCDGKVKVKVSGRRRKIFEVLFLDKYRRKAFRNLRFVLERLNVNVIDEIPFTRVVKVDYENGGTTYTRDIEVRDKLLYTLFNPSPEIQELYSSLKSEYPIVFKYEGKGAFDIPKLRKLNEEEEADIEKLVTYVIKPRYKNAFLKDSALERKHVEEKIEYEGKPMAISNKDWIKTEKPKEILIAKAEITNGIKKNLKKVAGNDLDYQKEEMPAIEEIKEKIKLFQPADFRERIAYERYLQALSSTPEKEEEIHRVFYKLIIGRKNFEDFYRKLYSIVPELI